MGKYYYSNYFEKNNVKVDREGGGIEVVEGVIGNVYPNPNLPKPINPVITPIPNNSSNPSNNATSGVDLNAHRQQEIAYEQKLALLTKEAGTIISKLSPLFAKIEKDKDD